MAYGTANVDTIQSSTANTPVQFNDGNGTQVGTLCRAWVNFNGTGTVAIRASFNVSSITDNGTGNYTVNFTNALNDANFGATVTNGFVSYANVPVTSDFTTTSVKVRCYNANDVAEDTSIVSVSVFR